jgi:hypothetical protein
MTGILDESIIKLPPTLSRCGYLLQQVHRSQYAAVYSVTDEKTGDAHGFEVFEIREQQPRTMPNGVSFAHREIYPSNEAFGKWAFAPRTRERAFEIFGEMEVKALRKKPVEGFELAI